MADVRYMNRLLPQAEREAARLGDDLPGLEHLVLAAATMADDDTARAALDTVGVTPGRLREAIAQVHQEALAAIGLATSASPTVAPTSRIHRSSGAAQEAFQEAVALAKGDGDQVRGGHVIIAAAAQSEGTFARALKLLGVARRDLVAAARSAMPVQGPA
ncbi:Clp protease N-terminal domain-containing protein [Cellulomonas sp. 179-A 4D5 NHS]|uniref:Clp protease N-terminal domain-containing protein n=1 Tax=Cellulomonas sp. 179-A 4D5 NHS TaxID=3142378 RepID=UPI0039A24D20